MLTKTRSQKYPDPKIGQRYGSLVVKANARAIRDERGNVVRRVKVRCDCGVTKIVRRGNIVTPYGIRSCGCGIGRKSQYAMTYTPMYRMYRTAKAAGYEFCKSWKNPKTFCEFFEPIMQHSKQQIHPTYTLQPLSPTNYYLD